MSTRIISEKDVVTLLPMAECMDLMAGTLQALTLGDAVNPLRFTTALPSKAGVLGLMPAYVGSDVQALGAKVVTVFHGNQGTPYDQHQGVVTLFETEHGSLVAIVDATTITSIRTAAVSGVATRLLAREDAGDLAILGSGVQAAAHLKAMLLVRKIRRVRVWSVPHDGAVAFAARESAQHDIEVEAMATAEEAVVGADLICTCTSSREPVLSGKWVAAGAHINAMGASFATSREVDTEGVAKSRLYVDRRESALNEAGEFLFAKREGAITDAHIQGEIGEILAGKVHGRGSAEEITLFKSLGLAVEDVASAAHVWRRACELGVGIEVEIGGRRH